MFRSVRLIKSHFVEYLIVQHRNSGIGSRERLIALVLKTPNLQRIVAVDPEKSLLDGAHRHRFANKVLTGIVDLLLQPIFFRLLESGFRLYDHKFVCGPWFVTCKADRTRARTGKRGT